MAIYENFPYSNFHEINLDWIISEVKRVSKLVDTVVLDVDAFIAEVLAEVSPEKIEEIVDQWFADHPEYLLYINRYVTPQDYGAVGDGVTNDHAAFESAINSGMDVYVPAGSYYVSQTIRFNKFNGKKFNAESAKITTDVPAFAVLIEDCSGSVMNFGEIVNSTASGIDIGTAAVGLTSNLKIAFSRILVDTASGTAIRIAPQTGDTIRDIQINGGIIDGCSTAIGLYNKNANMRNFKFFGIRTTSTNQAILTRGQVGGTDTIDRVIIADFPYSTNDNPTFLKVDAEVKLNDWWITAQSPIPNSHFNLNTYDHIIRVSWPDGDKYYSAKYGIKDWIWAEGDFLATLTGGMQIPSGVDLNTTDYCKPGEYRCTAASSLSNCPTTSSFHMTVKTIIGYWDPNAASLYLTRELFDFSGNEIRYFQNVYLSGGTWHYGPWKKLTPVNV